MHNLKKTAHEERIKEQDRQLKAPYTCRTKDKILEVGKRMKFYKKRNEERRKKNHAQKDRCLEVWLLITKYTILYKSPIKVLNNNHKILHNNSQWERYFLINTLYCQVLWSHISKQSYSVWSVPFLLPYMSCSSDGESRKKGSERWRKRWVRQKKKDI